MIFRRRSAPTASPESPASPAAASPPRGAGSAGPTDDEWLALDLSRDWREDGPFDISEVDLDADTVERIDLGALIVTPEPGLKVQLVVDQKTQAADTLLVAGQGFALQLNLLAAPGNPAYVAEWRQRLLDETAAAEGGVTLAEGPFGTELRRTLPVTDANGKASQLELRDWLIAGPRWLLHIRLLGQAATDTAARGPAAQLEEFCRNLIVRRDEVARVPGSPVPLRLPERR